MVGVLTEWSARVVPAAASPPGAAGGLRPDWKKSRDDDAAFDPRRGLWQADFGIRLARRLAACVHGGELSVEEIRRFFSANPSFGWIAAALEVLLAGDGPDRKNMDPRQAAAAAAMDLARETATRDQLEALLASAGATVGLVAASMGLDRETVEAYSDICFNVVDRRLELIYVKSVAAEYAARNPPVPDAFELPFPMACVMLGFVPPSSAAADGEPRAEEVPTREQVRACRNFREANKTLLKLKSEGALGSAWRAGAMRHLKGSAYLRRIEESGRNEGMGEILMRRMSEDAERMEEMRARFSTFEIAPSNTVPLEPPLTQPDRVLASEREILLDLRATHERQPPPDHWPPGSWMPYRDVPSHAAKTDAGATSGATLVVLNRGGSLCPPALTRAEAVSLREVWRRASERKTNPSCGGFRPGSARESEFDQWLRRPDFGIEFARRVAQAGIGPDIPGREAFFWLRAAAFLLEKEMRGATEDGGRGDPRDGAHGLPALRRVRRAMAIRGEPDACGLIVAALSAKGAGIPAVAAALGLEEPVVDAFATLYFNQIAMSSVSASDDRMDGLFSRAGVAPEMPCASLEIRRLLEMAPGLQIWELMALAGGGVLEDSRTAAVVLLESALAACGAVEIPDFQAPVTRNKQAMALLPVVKEAVDVDAKFAQTQSMRPDDNLILDQLNEDNERMRSLAAKKAAGPSANHGPDS